MDRLTDRTHARTGSDSDQMMLSLLVAIGGQYWYYDYMTDIPGAEDAWTDGCKDSSSRYPRCREYAATERVSFAAACFFAFMAMLSGFMPPIHDHGWDIKVRTRADEGSGIGDR